MLKRSLSFRICFLLCVAFAAISVQAQAPPADLDDYVARTMKTFEVPGVSIAIVKDGKVVLAKGYGVRKLGDPAPVDANTLFGIGSNTKAFTAAAIATLVDQEKLNWDDPVYERLKGFEMYDPYVSKEMRIRDLLCHRSGLGLGEGDLMFWPHTSFTRDDVVYRLRYLKPATSFRSHYAYNNLMFVTAGQVVAANSGESWDAYLREKIFLPLGMNSTNTSTDNYHEGDNWAHPHSKVDGKLQVIPFENLDNAGPAGSINSSASDLAKWVIVQLNRGKIPGTDQRLFSEKDSQEMWTQQTVVPFNEETPEELKALRPHFAGYGMGWFLRDYKGRKLVGHSGGVAGFVTRVLMVPEENLGVVILTNAEEDCAFESILYHVLDGYLGGPTEDYIAAFKSVEDKDRKKADETMAKAAAARDSRFQAIPSTRKIRRRLFRSLVRQGDDPAGKWRLAFEFSAHRQRPGRPAALAIRHLQGALARSHRGRRVRHLRVETRRLHRPLHHGGRFAAGGFQLRLSGFVLHAREGAREEVTEVME